MKKFKLGDLITTNYGKATELYIFICLNDKSMFPKGDSRRDNIQIMTVYDVQRERFNDWERVEYFKKYEY